MTKTKTNRYVKLHFVFLGFLLPAAPLSPPKCAHNIKVAFWPLQNDLVVMVLQLVSCHDVISFCISLPLVLLQKECCLWELCLRHALVFGAFREVIRGEIIFVNCVK